MNGINVEGQTPNHVLNILREAEHTITFKLIPNVGQYHDDYDDYNDDDDYDDDGDDGDDDDNDDENLSIPSPSSSYPMLVSIDDL